MIALKNLNRIKDITLGMERVLDLGGGRHPLPYATHVVDLSPYSQYNLNQKLTSHRQESLDPNFKPRFSDNTWFIHDVCEDKLPFEDNFFDLVLCNHVLEHVDDDNKAMQELYRVLNKNGTAILQVPIDLERNETFEDVNVKTRQERIEKFGQYDHLRIYGSDYFKKLEKIGFHVEQNRYATKFSKNEIKKYGIVENEIIPICKKN